jgi:hypothetical protein
MSKTYRALEDLPQLHGKVRAGLAKALPNHRPCPVKNCSCFITPRMAMCGQHWYLVPEGLRKAVWAEYRNHAGSTTHREAIDAACRAVEACCAQKEECRMQNAEVSR